MRQNIFITGFQDLTFTLVIAYRIFGGKEKGLIIDKEKNKDLMQWYSGKLNQYDAINMVASHEQEIELRGYLDLTKPDSLFESIAAIVRDENKKYLS